jgi:hypothetical protein
MKFFPALILVAFLSACANDDADQAQTIPADQIVFDDSASPFRGLGIRYDGHYKEQVQGAVYLLRFFPQGNVVLINGTNDVADQLPGRLRADAEGDPDLGWYNVPVTVREDSIFFRTYARKGEISYGGNIPATSMVRLLRHSHINGSRQIKEYIFQPDGQASGQ